jgi:hypothetical protein
VPNQGAIELIDAAVSREGEAWAKTIKVTRSDLRFGQFCRDVTEALCACITRHSIEPALKSKKFTRIAHMRERLKKEAADAKALAQKLRDFNSKYVLGQPTLVIPDDKALAQKVRDFNSKYVPGQPTLVISGRVFDLSTPAHDLCDRALLLEELAAACKDKGGPPPKTAAFDALATGLLRAYSNATQRKGTGGNVREGRSRLRDLVDAVLPTARKIAKDVTGQSLKAPASGALGDHLNNIAQRLQRGAQPSKS